MTVDGEHEVDGFCPEGTEPHAHMFAELPQSRRSLQSLCERRVEHLYELAALGEERGDSGAPTDPIVLDVEERRIDLDVAPEEVRRRLDRLGPVESKYRRGYGALYLDQVLQADEGCDFDFSAPCRASRPRRSRSAC